MQKILLVNVLSLFLIRWISDPFVGPLICLFWVSSGFQSPQLAPELTLRNPTPITPPQLTPELTLTLRNLTPITPPQLTPELTLILRNPTPSSCHNLHLNSYSHSGIPPPASHHNLHLNSHSHSGSQLHHLRHMNLL